jgi:hypothetical protein
MGFIGGTSFNIGAGVILGVIIYFGIGIFNQFVDSGSSEETTTETLSSSVAEYDQADQSVKNIFDEKQLPIRLPSGTVTSDFDPTIGDKIHQGYGNELIKKRAPGVTPSDIRDVLRDPDSIMPEEGLVIGENPTDSMELVIKLTDGVVLSASSGTTAEDPLGRTVIINEGHLTRKDATIEEVKNIIESPDQIWTPKDIDGGKSKINYYIGQLSNGDYTVIKVYMGGEYNTPDGAPNYNRASTETGPTTPNLQKVLRWIDSNVPEDVQRVY